jgi:hypothetical protein
MTDALTAIGRDGLRGRFYDAYIRALIDYLKEPSEELLKAVVKTATATDSVRGGYSSGETNLKTKVREKARRLQRGDRHEWARLLADEVEIYDFDFTAFHQLLELSPFAESSIIRADYGHGFVAVTGNFLARLLALKGYKNPDCEDFIVVVPDELLEKLEVIKIAENRTRTYVQLQD